MITAINSGGMWFGGIDGVIQKHAGDQFHRQASAAMPLRHLDTVRAFKRHSHSDDLRTPLRDVVYKAFEAVGNAGYKTVSLPAIRTGVMLGTVEPDAQSAVAELLAGIIEYFGDYPDSSVSDITFVIYASGDVYNQLEAQTLRLK
jgi:O-acetyl-ADP-ribose deacetylase (regulator of RNase III)